MKLSSKLPKRNGLSESDLPAALLARPRARRLLVVEVVVEKIERIYDEEEGYKYEVPTMRVVSGEYLTDPRDISTAQVLANRTKARRTGADTLPGVESIARGFRDSMASTLGVGESVTISAGGKSATIHGERIDPATGEVLDGGDES